MTETAMRPPTAAQAERRARTITAALALASKGGYDAVQMREVAANAGVALGTLYRDFPSKVHLLVSALAYELDSMRTALGRAHRQGETRVDRVVLVLERATRALQKDRNLTEAVVRALMAADVGVGPQVDAVRFAMSSILVDAMHADGEATEHDEALADILQDVWFARQLSWLGGRVDAAEARRDLEAAVRLVLR